jgi:hypothetical protein
MYPAVLCNASDPPSTTTTVARTLVLWVSAVEGFRCHAVSALVELAYMDDDADNEGSPRPFTPRAQSSPYSQWSEDTLREECSRRGLRAVGAKALLVERLETCDEVRAVSTPKSGRGGLKRELDDSFALASPSAQGKAAAGRSFRTTTDPIHGVMRIPLYCYEFIDTPQFQRLRYLKQLGTTSFVFQVWSHACHCLECN